MARLKTRSPWTWVPSLYFAEGLPYVAVMTLSVIVYKRLGVSNTDIALYTSWLYLPWVIKPFWSPIVDIISTKRRWVVAMQWLLGIGFGAVALALPGSMFFQLSLAAFWIVAFLSATHDIAADGFYMLGLNQEQQAFFVGIRSTFYRIALVAGQGLLVIIAGLFEEIGGDISMAWAMVFGIVSLFFIIAAAYHSWIMPYPAADICHSRLTGKEVITDFFTTFRSFFTKRHIGIAVAFMLLYRLPEAQLIKLISPFLLDTPADGGLGLTTVQVGMVYGTVGIIGLTLGGIIGGMVASRGGLRRWLIPMAWSMSLTCLTFVYLAYVPDHSILTINICVFIEQFGYGFGCTAYTLYLILFSDGPRKTSHYAICTGIMALGMMLPAMAAGWIQDNIGYGPFFLWTMVCCVATIGVSYLLKLPEVNGKS